MKKLNFYFFVIFSLILLSPSRQLLAGNPKLEIISAFSIGSGAFGIIIMSILAAYLKDTEQTACLGSCQFKKDITNIAIASAVTFGGGFFASLLLAAPTQNYASSVFGIFSLFTLASHALALYVDVSSWINWAKIENLHLESLHEYLAEKVLSRWAIVDASIRSVPILVALICGFFGLRELLHPAPVSSVSMV